MNVEELTHSEFNRICDMFSGDDQWFEATAITGQRSPFSDQKPMYVIELRSNRKYANKKIEHINRKLFSVAIGDVCLDELVNGEIIKGQSYTKLLIESRIMA